MKFIFITILSLTMSVSVWAGDRYAVKVVKQPEQKWHFQRLMAFSHDQGSRVVGRLISGRNLLPQGHIDVAAYSSSGKLIAETTTDYTPGILTPKMKKKGGVRFSANFAEKLPENSVIKVAFHRDQPQPEMMPSHTSIIAH